MKKRTVALGVAVLGIATALVLVSPLPGKLYRYYERRYGWSPHTSCDDQHWLTSEGTTVPFNRVVLVTIDTLRADHVSSYGYAHQTTPFLDSLAARGALFEDAVSSIGHTAPSHATMMTGRSPSGHGLRVNGETLDAAVPTLACMFQTMDFTTGAFVSVTFLRELTAGFDEVDAKHRPGGRTVDNAIVWIRSLPVDQPIFLWVHLYDPHNWRHPHKAASEFIEGMHQRSRTNEKEFSEYIASLHGLDRMPEPGGPLDWGPSRSEEIEISDAADLVRNIDQYDGLIAYSDAQVKRLFEALENDARPGTSLWVVTADHGEGIGSHGYHGHGMHLYGEQLHVPLIVWSSDPSAIARGERFSSLAALVDLFPTLADFFAATPPGPQKALEGRSLASALRDGRATWQRMAFAERRPIDESQLAMGWTEEGIYAAQTQRYKYIFHTAGKPEFFDLAEDTLELNNIEASDAPHRLALETYLNGKFRDLGIDASQAPSVKVEDLPAEHIEELRELGYVQ